MKHENMCARVLQTYTTYRLVLVSPFFEELNQLSVDRRVQLVAYSPQTCFAQVLHPANHVVLHPPVHQGQGLFMETTLNGGTFDPILVIALRTLSWSVPVCIFTLLPLRTQLLRDCEGQLGLHPDSPVTYWWVRCIIV